MTEDVLDFGPEHASAWYACWGEGTINTPEHDVREFLVSLGFTGRALDKALEIAERESAPLSKGDARPETTNRP